MIIPTLKQTLIFGVGGRHLFLEAPYIRVCITKIYMDAYRFAMFVFCRKIYSLRLIFMTIFIFRFARLSFRFMARCRRAEEEAWLVELASRPFFEVEIYSILIK